jgi:ribose transport system permease protein
MGSPVLVVALGMLLALVLGALFGLAHGLLITKGRIEPFIVTLGTLGIFRAYLTYFADGGAITLDNALADVYSPVYYGSLLGVPVPGVGVRVVALAGGFILNRTAYGRYVQAIGSNEQVARYAAVDVDRSRSSPTCCSGCAWASPRCSTCRGSARPRPPPACCGSWRRSPR